MAPRLLADGLRAATALHVGVHADTRVASMADGRRELHAGADGMVDGRFRARPLPAGSTVLVARAALSAQRGVHVGHSRRGARRGRALVHRRPALRVRQLLDHSPAPPAARSRLRIGADGAGVDLDYRHLRVVAAHRSQLQRLVVCPHGARLGPPRGMPRVWLLWLRQGGMALRGPRPSR